MKLTELRIGNILHTAESGQLVKVIDLNENALGVEILNSNDCLNIWHARPLPLSKELLNSFGFYLNKEYSDFTYFEKYHVTFNDYFSICYSHGFWHCQTIAPNLEIKYVHQLQNLYFALTNEELTFKP